ncbi:MAG: UvrD-helicase domain-containing protein [Acidobacteriota bacterium]
MKRHPELPDEAARRRASTVFDTNLVISAAAGTGKTSLLVERLLNAVGSGCISLEHMAAVTFTRKAAAQMRNRLAEGLERLHALARAQTLPAREEIEKGGSARACAWLVASRGVSWKELADRSLEALGMLDCFSVSTIHAFCAEILRRHPLEAGVDPRFHQDEGPRHEEVFEREWSAFLEVELASGAPREEAWRRALALFPLAELRQAARLLCGFAFPEPQRWQERCEDAARLLAPIYGPLADEAERILAGAAGLNPNFQDYLSSVSLLSRAFLEGRWPGGGSPPPAAPYDVLEKSYVPSVGRGATGVDPDQARAFAEEARRWLCRLCELDEAAAQALLEPLRAFVERFREAYLAAGWVSFDALLALTRDLLREHPQVRRSLQERYVHILVDEFQDTSPLQYEILFLLAGAEDAVRPDPWKVRLLPGRLFIVGDPKQSIYRFRKADIAAYDRAVRKICSEGGELLRLSANFRSDAPLIGALNALFEPEFTRDRESPAPDAGLLQPDYEPMAATSQPRGGEPAIEIWSTGVEPLRADDRRQLEAHAIARWIRQHAGEAGRFRYREVAILFRVTTNLAIYLEALRAAGVPVVVEGGREFLERPEVRHLRALLRALARPHDEVALLAVLRSALGGASDQDLLRHASAGGLWSYRGPVPAGSPAPVRRALEWLRGLAEQVQNLPTDDQIRLALERSGLELIEASHPDGAQSLANLRRYALELACAAREQALTLEQAIAAVHARADSMGAGVEESPLADETLDAVRILTVHKAKGMEFDAVIIPDLCRREKRGRSEAGGVDWARAPFEALALKTSRGLSARQILHEYQENRHEVTEGLRTLYVACTRARHRLILVAGAAGAAEARQRWPGALAHWSYDSAAPPPDGQRLAPGVVHRLVSGEPVSPRPEPEPALPEAEVRRFVEASRLAAASARDWDRHPSGLVEERWEREESSEGRGGSGAGALGAALGQAIHLALERWDGRGDGAGCLSEAVRRVAAEQPAGAAELEGAARSIWGKVVESDLPGLLRSERVGGRELPVLMAEQDGTVWRGSIDLLYRAKEGCWVVADYKTDDPGADPEAYARRYLPQLRVYARAVEKALGELPRAEIVWLRTATRTRFCAEELREPLRSL